MFERLRADDPVEREAAVARLRVAGARALPRLMALLHRDDDATSVRVAAVSILEGSDDARALEAALHLLTDPATPVVVAATLVLRGWLEREPGTRVLEALTTLALDRSRDAEARLAAMNALSVLPRDLVRPVLEQGMPMYRVPGDDPRAVREWVLAHGGSTALSHLHDLVVRARAHEAAEASARRREEWLAARGAAHAALARRGSTVALYDLREAFDAAASPLPIDFLAAIALIGDPSCLEPMARAWQRSLPDVWWRERLSQTAEEIVRRSRLSGRSAVVRRIRERWKGFL